MSDDNNKIVLSGTVSSVPVVDHVLYGEEFYTFDLSVPRLSGAVDIVPLTVSNRLMYDRIPTLEDHVSVSGQLRSYNKQIDGINRLVITVFAKSFEYETDLTNFVNDVMLIGFVCKPVIYRRTPFMREIADMLVAVNRAYGKSDYLPCIAWGRNARYAGNLGVGDCLRIEGRIQSRMYQKQLPTGEVQERTAYEVSCSLIVVSQTESFEKSPDENGECANGTQNDIPFGLSSENSSEEERVPCVSAPHAMQQENNAMRKGTRWPYAMSMPDMSGIAPDIDDEPIEEQSEHAAEENTVELEDEGAMDNSMPYEEPVMTPLTHGASEFDTDDDYDNNDGKN